MKIRKYIDEKTIEERVVRLAEEISVDYGDSEPIILSVLKGAFVFTADLIRKLKFMPKIDFIRVESYGSSTVSSGKVERKTNLTIDVKGKDVLIIEDIADTGLTIRYLTDYLKSLGARSIKVCVLLNKKIENKNIQIDYYGFEIENQFVVGYGLDFDQKYRNLPYIGILEKE
ncbi:MAG: hypoxanthine phosphoribosyltransferase [Proteobacteria bacterium]|nr:hypoxanthine phosphoribosyltransferase [Pseudomonadota bacterium]